MVRKWQKSNSGKRHLKPPNPRDRKRHIDVLHPRSHSKLNNSEGSNYASDRSVFFKSFIDRSDKFSANEDLDVCVDLHGDHGRRHGHQILRLCHGYQVHQNDIVKFQRGFNLVKMTLYVALFCISQRCYILSDYSFDLHLSNKK